jgi:hypothetical protein
VFDQLLKLDFFVGGSGLSESDFKRLFAKCTCGLVMTHSAFEEHACAVASNDGPGNNSVVIDLTVDSDDGF